MAGSPSSHGRAPGGTPELGGELDQEFDDWGRLHLPSDPPVARSRAGAEQLAEPEADARSVPRRDRGRDRGRDRAHAAAGVAESHHPRWSAHRRYVQTRRSERRARRRQRQSVVGRHPFVAAAVTILVVFTPVWVSLGEALGNPALGFSLSARAAEWSRAHGAGGLISWVENFYYSHHTPPVGGSPQAGVVPTTVTAPHTVTKNHVGLPVPAALVPFSGTRTWPAEGKWSPAGRLVNGVPAVYTTTLSPDAVHTSVVDGVAWLDTKLLSAELYSGTMIPGPPPSGPFYRHSAPITAASSSSLVCAFNAGFRIQDSLGGYYTDGRTIFPLVKGSASLVIYRNGTTALGAWGTEVNMSPDVVSVRQNLSLLVDNSQPVPGIATNQGSRWGAVLGNSIYVSRSGLGITKTSALVYVGGPNLDAVDLANLLVRAGAVRAMELDINFDWVNFASFNPSSPYGLASQSNATDLLPSSGMSPMQDRYFATWWGRDFITLSARTPPAA